MPSLTQEEAIRRAQLLHVERYDIDVDLTALTTGADVRARSVATFTCSEPGAETFVDCAATVVSATLNGEPLPPAVDGRIALPRLAERNELQVESVQSNTTTGSGVHRAVDPADGEVYVWMTFEPDEARFVWACFDQPDLKAPHAFTVTAPAAWTVTSNSGDVEIDDLGDTRRWRYADTPPLATYNTVINAGPLHEIRRTTDTHDLGIYARRSLAAVLERDAAEIFELTAQGLAFFGGVFEMPFPQRVYNQVFMPEFGGAMENYGCVTWTDGALRRVPPTPAEMASLARILLHEMAHMWFGNIVTMRWWDDLWLNEAFAEFACNWSAVRATRHTDAWASHLAAHKFEAYLADQGPISHPIRQRVRDVDEAASIFDSITYPKGASVLHQLMVYIGEDAFAAGMAAYFAQHRWGNTTLQDLIDALAAASGRDLDAWREAWLERAGTDRLSLETGDPTATLVARAPDGGSPRPHALGVGAYEPDGDGALTRTAFARVEVRGERTEVTLPAASFLLVNDDDLTFATTRPVGGDVDGFVAAAAKLPSAISRGVAVATVQDMLANGETGAADLVRCLTGVLLVETADAVIEPYLGLACTTAELWTPDAQRDEMRGLVADTCKQLAERPEQRTVALRSYARVAPDLSAVEWLREQAGDDVDLQWRALLRAADLGADTTADRDALQQRDPDPDAWVRALAVRAATPAAAEKAAVWQLVAVERKVPVVAVSTICNAFWRPGQEAALAPFPERYLEELPALGQGGMIPAMVYTSWLFPVVDIDENYLAQAEAVAGSLSPVGRARLLERLDEVRRMLRSRTGAGS